MQHTPAVLLLENTGMTGYQEVFTDPSYFGQLLVTTNAHIGNYGTKATDTESGNIKIAGLICKNYTEQFSRPLADESIQEYFERENLVGISGVDTRAIVRHIRSKGAMNAIISSEELDIQKLKNQLAKVPNMDGLELASKVSTKEAYVIGEADAKYKIAALDLGIKKNILECFVARGCQVKVFPAKTSYEVLKAYQPDGYFLSNGPGDPAPMDYAVTTAKSILSDNQPLFGICLGHQILALASGAKTEKMKFGHHGANHPVQDLATKQVMITSQNHGFAVKENGLPSNLEVTHRSLFDDTIQGIQRTDAPAFSFQGHPEASPGPRDMAPLFERFIELMKNPNKAMLVNGTEGDA